MITRFVDRISTILIHVNLKFWRELCQPIHQLLNAVLLLPTDMKLKKYLGESLLGPTYVVKTINNKKIIGSQVYTKKI